MITKFTSTNQDRENIIFKAANEALKKSTNADFANFTIKSVGEYFLCIEELNKIRMAAEAEKNY